MSLDQTWYHFEVFFNDSDPLREQLPADTEAEARRHAERLYPKARVIALRGISHSARFMRPDANVGGGAQLPPKRPGTIPPHSPPPPPQPPARQNFGPWWETLGVKADSPEDVVRKAYIDLLKQYHPDKVASLGPELKELAERKTQEINAAYDRSRGRR